MKIGAITPPRLRTVEEGERAATWLELFYDLIFVAAVAVLGVRLGNDPSPTGWLSYASYFVLVWWLWASHTFYADRFDTDDLVYRLIAGTQMVAIAFIGASVSLDAGGSTFVFAAAYTVVRILLVVLYARTHRHVPIVRPLVRGYMLGHGIACVFWAASIVVPEPGRFYLWGVALAIDFATPYVMRREQAAVPLDVSHLPERFGLFTILVLGETVVAVALGLGHVEWHAASTIAGVFGIVVATGIWWIHFDNVDGFVVRRRGEKRDWRPTVWIYSHLPLAIGLAMVGVGIEHAIEAADGHSAYGGGQRWVLVLGAALAFLSMAAIETASRRKVGGTVRRRIVGNRLTAFVASIVVGSISALNAALVVVFLALICIYQVGVDILATAVPADDDEPDDTASESNGVESPANDE